MNPILMLEQVSVTSKLPKHRGALEHPILQSVSFSLFPGEILGIAGGSGSGKSTLAKCIMELCPYQGSIRFFGKNKQMVFQDTLSSFDPRMTLRQSLEEPLEIQKTPRCTRSKLISQAVQKAGLDQNLLDSYPSELSGGQIQRAAIARAVILPVELLIADEALSSQDVSLQAQLGEQLKMFRQDGVGILFISHDLAFMRHLCDRIAVLQSGKIVELATAEKLFQAPQHSYTQKLLSAMPHYPF